MGRLLAIDVGSSALKAVLFDEAGQILAAAETGYGATALPHRQSPDAWWAAAAKAVRAVDARAADAVVLTGTMENLIPVDAEGRPTAPAMLYPDAAGTLHLPRFEARLAAAGAPAILGNPPEPLMTAFKLQAFREEAPDAASRSSRFLVGAKDALALRMTGRAATDPTTASTAGLMDMARRRWSPELCEIFDVATAHLPEILPGGAIIGTLGAEAAAALGLREGTPILNGCGDAGATTVGSFCDGPTDLSLYLGTSGWVARVAPASTLGGERPVYRLAHPTEGLLIEITPILSAGGATAWLRTLLGRSVAETDGLAAAADAAPPDLVFLPYLSGERSPFLDLGVRGAFVGLDARHGPGDIAYAVLEGVALAIAANLPTLEPTPRSREAGSLAMVGGGAASLIWPQIVADILGRPVEVPPDPALATARGAFRIAAAALAWPNSTRSSLIAFEPRPERRARAQRLGEVFAAATAFARGIAPRLGRD
jgi:xylulokinase